MIRLKRKPTPPGEILAEEYLKPLKLTQKELANHLDCDLKVINRIVNEKTSISAEMAIKLAATFKTTPDFWLNAQKAIDLFRAKKKLGKLPKPLKLKTSLLPA